MKSPLPLILSLAATSIVARAEVVRVEMVRRVDVAGSGYEKIAGRLHFAVDPKDPRNRVIADLDLAPVNTSGRVEFSSDLYILKPKDPAAGNGAAILEVSNRGGRALVTGFNRGGTRDPETDADLGDRFLMRQGFTLVTVGWEFDVPPAPGLLRIEVPSATDAGKPVTGIVRARFTPDARTKEHTPTDLAAYPPIDPDGAATGIAILRSMTEPVRTVLPRTSWRLRERTFVLEGGFEPGKTYEFSHAAANPPIAGLGFAAFRDTAAWLKYRTEIAPAMRYTYAFGASQSGRFLRDFLYHGFNTDERDRPVFDGVMAHIAGAARLNLNARWSVPREFGTYSVTAFPFADLAQTDPASGTREGLLENARVRHPPKIFYTNTSVEYWGGGRVAALVHTDPAGTSDLALPENVRFYAFAGTQHGAARFPPAPHAVGQQLPNPVDFWWTLRALLPAMHRWVKDGSPPPPSSYPTFRDGTLVKAATLKFPAIPGIPSPRHLTGGWRVTNTLISGGAGGGTPLPLLVSQVDADGNELGGIRLPDVAVPLATCTGWNFRRPSAGAPDTLVGLQGSWIPFPATRTARTSAQDPRRSVEERYVSRSDYISKYQAAVDALVRQGYLLAEDSTRIMPRAGEAWDAVMAASATERPAVK